MLKDIYQLYDLLQANYVIYYVKYLIIICNKSIISCLITII